MVIENIFVFPPYTSLLAYSNSRVDRDRFKPRPHGRDLFKLVFVFSSSGC